MPQHDMQNNPAKRYASLMADALRKAAEAKRAVQQARAAAESAPELDEFARRLATALGNPGTDSDGSQPRSDPEVDNDDEQPVDVWADVEFSPAEIEEAALPDPQSEGPAAYGTGPQGSGDYVVRQGDCMASIAMEHGFFWETLWNDPANRELNSIRSDPHVLLPGDRVLIPEKRRKEEPGQTEMRHRFVRKGEPSLLRATFLNWDDTPRASEPYFLDVDGAPFRGELDENGTLEVRISGTARTAVVRLGVAPLDEVFNLQLGALDPISERSGVSARLINLGHLNAGSDKDRPIAPRAVCSFQESRELARTGELDDATRASLEERHRAD